MDLSACTVFTRKLADEFAPDIRRHPQFMEHLLGIGNLPPQAVYPEEEYERCSSVGCPEVCSQFSTLKYSLNSSIFMLQPGHSQARGLLPFGQKTA